MYRDLFSYLNGNSTQENYVAAKNRPILTSGEQIDFPYITPADFEQHDKQLIHQRTDGVLVSDEVMDEAAVEDEEQLIQYQKVLNTTVSAKVKKFNWLFSEIYRFSQNSPRGRLLYITKLTPLLKSLDTEDANLPLIISLERKYSLRNKLRNRTGKLNSQLRRKNDLMPIGQIQELDGYALRDYIRRPGNTPEEKAGPKQQLMGVKRYQDYSKLENQFLVYFATRILYLECYRYQKEEQTEHLETVTKFKQVIEAFKQDPIVKEIKIRGFKMTRPNYPLQKTPDYRGFYDAYQDYLKDKKEKINIWKYRNRLFGEVFYVYILAALLQLDGKNVSPTNNIKLRNTPDMGSYLISSKVNFQVRLLEGAYDFAVEKRGDLNNGDYCLSITKHDLLSKELRVLQMQIPIWIFWYKPSSSVLDQASIYLAERSGLVFYLEGETYPEDPKWLWQFPQNDEIPKFLAQQIIIPMVERM